MVRDRMMCGDGEKSMQSLFTPIVTLLLATATGCRPKDTLDPDRELQEVEYLRLDRNVRVELLELEMDPVDLDDRHREQEVGLGDLAVARPVGAVLLLRPRQLTFDVLGEPVLLSLLGG